ncbi:hypothetical protein NFI96_012392 [Prochilodus magdalenae]|nr:hypothetical protein NFI96_012392 [Prochilodus magdalenae]
MDMIGLRYGRTSLGSPLSWAEGLNRLHCHPRGGQLLTLLGQGDSVDSQHTQEERTSEGSPAGARPSGAEGAKKATEAMTTRHTSLRSHTKQQSQPRSCIQAYIAKRSAERGTQWCKAPPLDSREVEACSLEWPITLLRLAIRWTSLGLVVPGEGLIQYPPPPAKGGITVTAEDLECLRDGEFLNDVIIDFYLKYLQLERADQDVANRSHIFSSFFYKQLTRKDNSSEGEAGGTAQERRHRRVKTWTRHVDIFSKDYLFIPVNQEAHWYLVVICFPGLLAPELVPWKCPASTNSSGTTHKPQSPSGPSGQDRPPSTGQHQTGTVDGPKRGPHELPDCTVLSCRREKVIRRPCILIMDSLKLSYHKRIFALLREYLQVEWEVRKGTRRVFNDDNIRGSPCRVPLQDNSSDCGLYLLQYVESFLQNPVVHFDLPLRLERWFPRQQVRKKREELRELVLQLYRRQGGGAEQGSG